MNIKSKELGMSPIHRIIEASNISNGGFEYVDKSYVKSFNKNQKIPELLNLLVIINECFSIIDELPVNKFESEYGFETLGIEQFMDFEKIVQHRSDFIEASINAKNLIEYIPLKIELSLDKNKEVQLIISSTPEESHKYDIEAYLHEETSIAIKHGSLQKKTLDILSNIKEQSFTYAKPITLDITVQEVFDFITETAATILVVYKEHYEKFKVAALEDHKNYGNRLTQKQAKEKEKALKELSKQVNALKNSDLDSLSARNDPELLSALKVINSKVSLAKTNNNSDVIGF